MDFNKLIGRSRGYVFDGLDNQRRPSDYVFGLLADHHRPEHKAYRLGIINIDSHITYVNYLNKSNIDNCHKQHNYQHQVSNEYQHDMDNQLNSETNNLFPVDSRYRLS